MTVDWLGPNVVLKGCREQRGMRLWDTRVGAESTEPRIQHSSNIIHVRSIDEENLDEKKLLWQW